MKLKFGQPVHATTRPVTGDLNRDDQITPADAAIALAFAAGGSASCDAATLAAADVSGDNRVTSLDVHMVLQPAGGMIELWPRSVKSATLITARNGFDLAPDDATVPPN